jgi:hypothetical protein
VRADALSSGAACPQLFPEESDESSACRTQHRKGIPAERNMGRDMMRTSKRICPVTGTIPAIPDSRCRIPGDPVRTALATQFRLARGLQFQIHPVVMEDCHTLEANTSLMAPSSNADSTLECSGHRLVIAVRGLASITQRDTALDDGQGMSDSRPSSRRFGGRIRNAPRLRPGPQVSVLPLHCYGFPSSARWSVYFQSNTFTSCG